MKSIYLPILFILFMVASLVAQAADNDELRVMPVQGNVHMIINTGSHHYPFQVSDEGIVLLNTPPPEMLPQVLEIFSEMTSQPFNALIQTSGVSSYMQGYIELMESRAQPILEYLPYTLFNRFPDEFDEPLPDAQNLYPFYLPKVDLYSGEAIFVHHVPRAITDSDSIVLFRGSDVIVTGPVYTQGSYPEIDLDRGGSIQGLIDALNLVLDLAVPGNLASGGTLFFPGQGSISEESTVAEYRNMVVIIRDRIQSMMNDGMTLRQIQAARPTLGYDGEHGATEEESSAFVETIYLSLGGE